VNPGGEGPATGSGFAVRCGIDTVEIARIERLLRETDPADLAKIFSAGELADSGHGPGRAASLAARFAAKEACLKLFPRETALATITAEDFAVARDPYGAPQLVTSPNGQAVLDRYRIPRIALSLTHDKVSASAMATGTPAPIAVPWIGKVVYHALPYRRRVVMDNLTRVYGQTLPAAEIVRIAQAHYGHLARLLGEFVRYAFLSRAQRAALVRVENHEQLERFFERNKGFLVLTGHFGNWEVATLAGIGNFPGYQGRFHFVRRALKPAWFDALVTRRFREGGLGVFAKRGALDAMLDRLEAGDGIVFPFDQHAQGGDGIRVEFFGHAAGTFRSLALIALSTGVPVFPAASWREADGRHVLRFEAPLAPIEHEDVDEAIRLTTRSYNAALERLILRHPEQWYWVHRRWKEPIQK
jgi:KDO2-lipid IV(A) lauroyltransferase